MNVVKFTGRRIAKPAFSSRDYQSGDLLSGLAHQIGHEIGNPLTAIISLGSLLERLAQEVAQGSVPEKFPEYLNSMVSESWRISQLNEKMVLLLSNRSNNTELSPVARVTERAIQKLQNFKGFQELDPELQYSGEDLSIQIDPSQFQALIYELLKNAHFESKTGDPNIPVKISASSSDQGETEIEISNSFNSSLPKKLEDIFYPFKKGEESKKTSGLGLALAWAIVERAGGTLEAEEDLKNSSRIFKIRLKVPSKLVEIDLNHKSSGQPQQEAINNVSRLQKKTSVLIIEDEQMVATAISKILSVTLGKDTELETFILPGQAGLKEILSGKNFQAILCDLNLKDISGQEIHKTISSKRPEILNRFAFITGDRNTPEVQYFMKNSGQAWLHKPFETDDLLALINKLLLAS